MPMTFPRSFALASCVAIGVCGGLAAGAAAPATLPFESVRPGMKGIGRTAFQGERIEEFQVEIVGVIPHIGPEQDLILARCSGGPLATTGIMAGMSGSPVFIDGKLIGAVAYSWGFAKEPLAGITPIGEMLAVGSRPDTTGAGRRRAGSRVAWRDVLSSAERPADLAAFFATRLDRLGARPVSGASPALPLAVSGLGAAGIARIAPDLQRAGFLPMQSSASGAGAAPASPFQPGSPVGVKLVRGDVDMTATGTVTWVDGDRLYAFGHPLYGLGDVDLPLTAARVETLLPSLERSAKIAVPLAEAGAFRQDRASAIFGKIGATPSMIPIRLQLTDGAGTKRTYAFDVADDPLLAPILLYVSLQGVVEAVERTFGAATVRLQEGSVIKVDGSDDVRLDNLFAGDGAATSACGLSAYLLYVLMNNEWADARVRGVNLLFEYDRTPRTALVRRVTLDRYRVTAGSTVTARIIVSPYRGPDAVLEREIAIPEETPAGPLTLQVGSAAAINRTDDVEGPIYPRDLEQLVTLINRLRRNDRVYVLASRSDSGAYLGGARLPNLPPSLTSILTRPRSFGNFAYVPERGILEEEIRTDTAVEGFARVSVEVMAK
jgi:hypothetical protein